MKKRQFIRILHRYIEGTTTEEEGKLVETYYSLLLKKSEIESGDISIGNGGAASKQELLDEVWHKIKDMRPDKGKAIRFSPALWKAAAVLFILVASGVIFYTLNRKQARDKNILVSGNQGNKTNGIKPGGNAGILTLSNGEKVILNRASNGALTQQGNMKVVKLNSGQLTYQGVISKGADTKRPVYNTLSTPRGGQYEVVLSDGTKVWLNAASSLKYPVAFSGETRTVKIDGEGYFEIAPNAQKPFIVNVGVLKVEVLGTHFNVNAYERNDIKTTLVAGAVKVTGGERSVLLNPGETARFDDGTGDMKVSEVNVAAITAWKNGLFYFDNTNIKEIMEEVGRWYNVNVVYETTNLEHKMYRGTLPRYSEVSALLKMLEMTGTVHFKIDGRAITVLD